jgi:hypothetical protein
VSNVDILRALVNKMLTEIKVSGLKLRDAEVKCFHDIFGFSIDDHKSFMRLIKDVNGWIAGSAKMKLWDYSPKSVRAFQKLFTADVNLDGKLFFVGKIGSDNKMLSVERGSSLYRTSKIGVLNWSYGGPLVRGDDDYVLVIAQTIPRSKILLTNITKAKHTALVSLIDKLRSKLGMSFDDSFNSKAPTLDRILSLLMHIEDYADEKEVILFGTERVKCKFVKYLKSPWD